VPEDSVRPETQTLVVLIRRKGFVGSFKSFIFIIALSPYLNYFKLIILLGTVFFGFEDIKFLNKFKSVSVKIKLIKARIKLGKNRIILRVGMISADTKGNTNGESFFSTND
jgi:hypothetical protein